VLCIGAYSLSIVSIVFFSFYFQFLLIPKLLPTILPIFRSWIECSITSIKISRAGNTIFSPRGYRSFFSGITRPSAKKLVISFTISIKEYIRIEFKYTTKEDERLVDIRYIGNKEKEAKFNVDFRN